MKAKGRRMGAAFLGATLALTGLIVFAVLHPASSSAAECGGGTGTPGGHSSALFGVDAASKTNAWAVGYVNSTGADRTLAMHWNGHRWTRFRTPNPGSSCDQDRLYAVAIVSPSDVWAVGSTLGGSGEQPFVLRWNGVSWSQTATPDPGRFDELTGIAAVSHSDAWAVGKTSHQIGTGGRTFVLHWNGGTWSRVPSPNPGTDTRKDDRLSSVDATSSSNAWAVGRRTGATGQWPLLLRWDGQSWRRSSRIDTGHGGLTGVDLLSRRLGWSVGESAALRTWTVRWGGARWRRVDSPNQSSGSGGRNFLSDVSAVSRANAWAVGDYYVGGRAKSLALRWNGSVWRQVKSPDPGLTFTYLSDVSAVSASEAWAVGAADSFAARSHMVIVHWNGRRWATAAVADVGAPAGSGNIPYLVLGALALLLVAALARGFSVVAPRAPAAQRQP
jgi:hypothetical protein